MPSYFDTDHSKRASQQAWPPMSSIYSPSIGGGLASDSSVFDMSSLHPSHNLSYNGSYRLNGSDADQPSEAQKILAAMAACGTDAEYDDFDGNSHRPKQSYAAYGQSPEELLVDDSNGYSSDSSIDTPYNLTAEQSIPFEFSAGQQDKASIERQPSLNSSSYFTASANGSHSSMGLERRPSCCFEPPPIEQHVKESSVPWDSALVRRLSSTPVTPAMLAMSSVSGGGVAPLSAQLPSSNAISYSLAPTQSSSSSMMRSYSCPAQTQAEFQALRSKWNAEATSALASTSTGPAPAASSSGSITSSPRPKIARRNTSANIAALRRQRDAYEEASPYAPDADVHATFGSHSHLLSPANKSNPFKRSRMSFTAIQEADDAYWERATSPPKALSSVELSTPASPPPKSPTRPSLNRFFTTPEFFINDSNDHDDSA